MTRVQPEAKAILVAARRDDVTLRNATRLGIGIVWSVSEGLAVVEEVEVRRRVITLKHTLIEAAGDDGRPPRSLVDRRVAARSGGSRPGRHEQAEYVT